MRPRSVAGSGRRCSSGSLRLPFIRHTCSPAGSPRTDHVPPANATLASMRRGGLDGRTGSRIRNPRRFSSTIGRRREPLGGRRGVRCRSSSRFWWFSQSGLLLRRKSRAGVSRSGLLRFDGLPLTPHIQMPRSRASWTTLDWQQRRGVQVHAGRSHPTRTRKAHGPAVIMSLLPESIEVCILRTAAGAVP